MYCLPSSYLALLLPMVRFLTSRQTETDRHKQTQTDRDRYRKRQTETDTDRQADRPTDRQTETERVGESTNILYFPFGRHMVGIGNYDLCISMHISIERESERDGSFLKREIRVLNYEKADATLIPVSGLYVT